MQIPCPPAALGRFPLMHTKHAAVNIKSWPVRSMCALRHCWHGRTEAALLVTPQGPRSPFRFHSTLKATPMRSGNAKWWLLNDSQFTQLSFLHSCPLYSLLCMFNGIWTRIFFPVSTDDLNSFPNKSPTFGALSLCTAIQRGNQCKTCN